MCECRTCLAQCAHHKITSGTCEQAGFESIDTNSECQAGIADLGIKANFISKEADDNALHGCWVDVMGEPIGLFNSGGEKDEDGKYSATYSEKFYGICRHKDCNDDALDTDANDYYLEEIGEAKYCETCDKGSMTSTCNIFFYCYGKR